MARKLASLSLLLLVSSVYFYTATGRAIMDDGDALYASVAQQMVERGDWITPYANGVRFLDKPPFMYWLMGTAYRLLGMNEFAARLPSVLSVLGTGWLLFLIGKKSGDPSAAMIMAVTGTMSVGTFLFTRQVFPDMLLVFFLTLALFAFYAWYSDSAHPMLPAMVFYAALAAAVLTKGLVGMVFPIAIILVFLAWSHDLSRVRRFYLWQGSLLFLALALPWHILAALRNPGFLWYFFINEHFLRFLGRRQPVDYESIPVFVFWALIPLWLFPWSAFLPAVRSLLRGLRSRGSATGMLVRLSLSWIVVVLGFFTFSSRIEHYALPLIPALAIVIGLVLSPEPHTNTEDLHPRDRWVDRGFAFLAILGAAGGVVILAALWLWGMTDRGSPLGQGEAAHQIQAYPNYFGPLFDLPPQTISGLRMPLLGTGAALFVALPAAWWLNRRGWRLHAVAALAGMMAAFCLFAYQSLGVCEEGLSSKQFGRVLSRLYQSGDTAITVGDFEAANSMNFYAPDPLDIYQGTAAVLEWGLRYPDAPRRILSRTDFELRWRGRQRTFLLVPDGKIEGLHLNDSYIVLQSGGRTLLCNQPVYGSPEFNPR
jgi:4-amino-4-deoxy-L-arabinose transferase-like glycosyltransferase